MGKESILFYTIFLRNYLFSLMFLYRLSSVEDPVALSHEKKVKYSSSTDLKHSILFLESLQGNHYTEHSSDFHTENEG